MSPSAVSLAMILAIVGLGVIIGFLAGVAPEDEPGTVDGWRPRLRRGVDVPADGRRGLHHLLFSGSQRLGLFPRRSNPVHPGLRHAGLRGLILYPAGNLGSGTKVSATDPIRFLQPALRQQVSGRVCVRGGRHLLDPLPATSNHRTGYYRQRCKFRWHRPDTCHGDLGGSVGGVRVCERRPRRGLDQRPEGCVDGLRGGLHRHRHTVHSLRWHRPHVLRFGAGAAGST